MTTDKSSILSRYGRTQEQIEAFYDLNRKNLSYRFALMDLPDESYKPLLLCSACNGELVPHRFITKEKRKRHHFESSLDMSPINPTSYLMAHIYQCEHCGAKRTYGNEAIKRAPRAMEGL